MNEAQIITYGFIALVGIAFYAVGVALYFTFRR